MNIQDVHPGDLLMMTVNGPRYGGPQHGDTLKAALHQYDRAWILTRRMNGCYWHLYVDDSGGDRAINHLLRNTILIRRGRPR